MLKYASISAFFFSLCLLEVEEAVCYGKVEQNMALWNKVLEWVIHSFWASGFLQINKDKILFNEIIMKMSYYMYNSVKNCLTYNNSLFLLFGLLDLWSLSPPWSILLSLQSIMILFILILKPCSIQAITYRMPHPLYVFFYRETT